MPGTGCLDTLVASLFLILNLIKESFHDIKSNMRKNYRKVYRKYSDFGDYLINTIRRLGRSWK